MDASPFCSEVSSEAHLTKVLGAAVVVDFQALLDGAQVHRLRDDSVVVANQARVDRLSEPGGTGPEASDDLLNKAGALVLEVASSP